MVASSLLLLFIPLVVDAAVVKEGFAIEFGLQFPGGPSSLMTRIHQRKSWTALELYDRTREASQLPNPDIHEVFDALGPVIQCPQKLLHSYGQGDGEKKICGSMEDSSCVVVSLGSNNIWDFEESIIKRHPHCKIHAFDCFVPSKVPHKIAHAVTFHEKCIGPRDEVISGKQFLSWPSLLNLINLKTAPTALKMDIEGYEWTVIREMLVASPHHLLPSSISFELHTSTYLPEITWQKRTRQAPEVALFMEYLLKFGYILVDRHDNPFCQHCSELVVAKVLTIASHA